MSLNKLTLDQALDLETEGLITIYDFVDNYNDTQYHTRAREWVDNYKAMLFKFRQYKAYRVSNLLNCDYQITVNIEPQEPHVTMEWKHLFAKSTKDLEKLNQYHSKGQYVYVLTNPGYDFIKIGKAVNPQQRLRQINSAGVVSEWTLYWSLPVENDYMIENLVHKALSVYRRNSNQGSHREYFQIDKQYAVDTILHLAEDFKTGEPIYY